MEIKKMGINVQQKGKEGERQVAKELNAMLQAVLASQQWPAEVVAACTNSIQRNQNQSAVGGSDLSNTFGLAIEVKRQEQLSIGTWWAQCTAAAQRNNEHPVLIYRQNNKPWRVVTLGALPLPGNRAAQSIRMEFSWEDFKAWFYQWVYYKLLAGETPRV